MLHVLQVGIRVDITEREEDRRGGVGIVLGAKVDRLLHVHEADGLTVGSDGALDRVRHRDARQQDDIGSVLLDVLDQAVGVLGLDAAIGQQGIDALAKGLLPAHRLVHEVVVLELKQLTK